MLVVTIELWPKGDRSKASTLGIISIANDGTGDESTGNYDCVASHAGVYFGRRPKPFKRAKVTGFLRRLSPYRLVARALKAMGET